MRWIFEDTSTVDQTDRQVLLNYLAKHDITPEGHFHEALQDDDGWTWRYPAYAVKCLATNPALEQKLKEKLKLLCTEQGGRRDELLKQKLQEKISLFSRVNRRNQVDRLDEQVEENHIEQNYQNILVEFRALYALTALMGYRCVGLEQPSGKPGVSAAKNCDLALIEIEKDGRTIFADAKERSGEILTQCEIEHSIKGRTVKVTHFDPDFEFIGWLTKKIHECDAKGADFLICHLPGWGLGDFSSSQLKGYLDDILPSTLTWTQGRPSWQIQSTWVKQVIIIKRMGCFVIDITPVSINQRQTAMHPHGTIRV